MRAMGLIMLRRVSQQSVDGSQERHTVSDDDRGRSCWAVDRAHRRWFAAEWESARAAERARAALDAVIRELDLLEIRELFAMHAEGR